MVWEVLIPIVGICTFLDGAVSARRMKKYGTASELNPYARKLAYLIGAVPALAIVLATQTTAITLIAAGCGCRTLYAVYAGMKVLWTGMQLNSLETEKHLNGR